MPYPYVTVDVFTETAFGGNPLAVVTDARGLDADAMQRIASEFNYSETTFILPPEDPAHTARVRIFTPAREVPFAGHPNVGTALVVAWAGNCLGRPVGDVVKFEEEAGLVPVAIARDRNGAARRATLTAPQPLAIGAEVEPSIVSACCGLAVEQVDCTAHRPVSVSVGLPFVVARLTDRAALSAAAPDVGAFRHFAAGMPTPDLLVYVYTAGDGGRVDYHCRMFAPLDNIMEDPATGSANAALVGLLTQLDERSDCAVELRIAQGEDMGRPSLLLAGARKVFGKVEDIRIGGGAVEMMSGTLRAV
ncbi:MAG: PhzF family phenazine biosynthesis protein [Alphaproteobacteria bacterium]